MIFITGTTGSGKSTLLKILKNLGLSGVDTGEFWRKYFNINLDVSKILNEEKIKHSNPFWEYEEVLKSVDTTKEIAVSGYRSIKNFTEFYRFALMQNHNLKKEMKIIFIEAEKTLLMERYMNRENLNLTDAEIRYNLDLELDKKWGIFNTKKYATHFFMNNGNIKDMELFATTLL